MVFTKDTNKTKDMKKMEDMEIRNNHKNQKTVKTASAIFSESLKSLKSLMQIFVESAKSAKSIFATFASANFAGKASCESTMRYGVRSWIPSCLFRYSLDSHLSRSRSACAPCTPSLFKDKSQLSFPSLASLICLCMLTVGVVNAWGDTRSFTPTNFDGQGNSSGGSISYTNSPITVSSSKGYGYSTGQTRVYSGGTLVISCSSGYTITGVALTFTGASYQGGLETSYTGLSTTSWTSPTLTGTARISGITVTYTAGTAGPSITVSTTSLTAVGYSTADFSQQVKSFTVSGSSLKANVTVTAPTGFEVCKTSGGPYTSSVSFDKGSGTLSASPVYVRLQSGKSAGEYSGSITCASTDATSKTVALSGSVPFTVTWKANGTIYATTYVTYATGTGTAIGTLPTDPDPDDYCGDAFYGWYDGDSYKNASVAPSIIRTSTKITSDKTYKAVFADADDGSLTSTLTASEQGWSNSANATTKTISTITYSWAQNSGTSAPKYYTSGSAVRLYVETNGTKGNQVIISSSNTITSVVFTYVEDYEFLTNAPSVGSLTSDGEWSGSATSITFTNKNKDQVRIQSIVVTYSATTYSNYTTTCCTKLGSINGSVSWSGGTSATLTWDKLSNVAASTPYTITCKQTGGSSAGSVGSVDLTGSKATCTITGLTAGTSYDFKIAVSAASGYCDKDSTITSRAPQIMATTDENLVDVTYAEGDGPSTNASYFTFSGVGLTGDITVTAPTNFQVSKTSSSSGFGSSVTVSPSTGSITNQKIWIRLASGLTNASSPYGGNVTLSGGGAATVNVAITGSVSSACTVPTVKTPTLASIASGTITVSCASVTVDENCDASEYGFVWKAGSAPSSTSDGNKVKVGEGTPAGSYSSGLSISFSTETTYYIKAYAINSAGTTLSSALSVTPQSVTYNSNGGSDVATAYVNNGGTVSQPSNPTKTHYTFGGWYTDNGIWASAVNFSSTITEDKTYYAKWNPVSYTITTSGLTNVAPASDFPTSFTYTGSTTTDLNRTLTVDEDNFFLPDALTVTMGGATLTKGTHYSYDNSTGAFTFDVVITGNIVISGSAVAKLKSIAITTTPTKTVYFAGEAFSNTGAVVTATMGDETTKAVSGSAVWTPSGALTAEASKTMTATYTERGISKTAKKI